MTVGFRHADTRVPFFWEAAAQPPARWHAAGEGPCQYLADTPDGAWAEFLRHEEITDPADVAGVARSLWAVAVPDDVLAAAVPVEMSDAARDVEPAELTSDAESYPICQEIARSIRAGGAAALIAPTAALLPGCANGQVTAGGLQEAAPRDGQVWALYGARPDLRGYRVVDRGAPPARVLAKVRRVADSRIRPRVTERGI